MVCFLEKVNSWLRVVGYSNIENRQTHAIQKCNIFTLGFYTHSWIITKHGHNCSSYICVLAYDTYFWVYIQQNLVFFESFTIIYVSPQVDVYSESLMQVLNSKQTQQIISPHHGFMPAFVTNGLLKLLLAWVMRYNDGLLVLTLYMSSYNFLLGTSKQWNQDMQAPSIHF